MERVVFSAQRIRGLVKRTELSVILSVVIIGLTSGCRDSGVPVGDTGNSDNQASCCMDALTGFERTLKSGNGQVASRKPDCDHFAEWGYAGEPLEGENCIDWGLKSWGDMAGAEASTIAVVDIEDSVTGYYDGHVENRTCSYYTGVGNEIFDVANYGLPVEFKVIDLWKGADAQISGAVVFGHCERESAPLCKIGGAEWYIQPGLNLVLMVNDCCASQYRNGYLQVLAIYPIENDHVYDWDGDAIPVDDVRKIMIDDASPEVEPADAPCRSPGTADATVSDIGETVDVDVVVGSETVD